ncbi:hypothetical protein AA309_26555 [Microvirga vignae]|uniref:Uncharacterized protein n=1 Tax=Microvirga vignae TaxID=1225564 RepID=A0A0H1R530_9HYPH|nr:hypothetical protein [Microvirga vignae]KLK90295.1 hypothetical protein AA309_26555 [Microvirga vignae]
MSDDKSTPVLVRLAPDQIKAVDAWRRQQSEIPTRPEAIRRLMELGLQPGTGESIEQAFKRWWRELCEDDDTPEALKQLDLSDSEIADWFSNAVLHEWESRARELARKKPTKKNR